MVADMAEEAAVTQPDGDAQALRAENASLHDRMLRALADAENTRRRTDRSMQDARQYAVSNLARELLPVLDNLQRAIAAAEQAGAATTADGGLLEGVRATARMLQATLAQFGVREIQALGARFDPSLHDAMLEEDDPTHPSGSVIRVAENGYTIHDRLLRPARVVLAKRRVEAPAPGLATGQKSPSRG
jgi:molecular chaperone GrpE